MFVELPINTESPPQKQTTELSFVLKESPIANVGVFATHAIAGGTQLRLFPGPPSRLLTRDVLQKTPLLERFSEFFGVDATEGVYVAADFGQMEIDWYLNHSDTPNASHDKNYDYYALRNITAGEEITIDYREL